MPEPPIAPAAEGAASGAVGEDPVSFPPPRDEELQQAEKRASTGDRESTLVEQEEGARRTALQKVWWGLRWVGDLMVKQWFLLGIALVIILASQFPNVARNGGIIQAQWSIKYLLVAIIFLVSGLSLPLANLYKRARDWKLHLATHVTNFLLFPTIVFAIVSCVRAADPNFEKFDRYAMVGMVVLGCVPTTVSSNVVMTGQAGGDESAATIEVMLGNLLGTFLSPALLGMFMSGPWAFGKPVAEGGGGNARIYEEVIKQLGYTVFIPLFVGELIQYIWPRQTRWFRLTFRLAKVGSLCLIGVIWSTFSGAFYERVFERLSGETVAFIVTVDIGLYVLHSVLLFILARWIPLPTYWRSGVKGPLFDPETTIALLFCGAAKGVALGGPVVQILYGGLDPAAAATVSLPLVIYQGSQVVLGQATVAILKRWRVRTEVRESEEVKEGVV